ncbi:MAG: nucleotide exchange factor GrpE [Candidatus Thermoplasmatota archaeon]|nr:nucleotide exchange factor GrpE [Candidatus Thermoplasmatota archaeon]
MHGVVLNESLKKDIWKRDEFTCVICGKMVPWNEVCIIHKVHCEGPGKKDPSNLLTACANCMEETSRAPKDRGREKSRIRRILGELRGMTEVQEEVTFEDDYEEEVIRLSVKIKELKRDNRMLGEAVQEKEKVAIAYKVKMDRAFKDLENNRKRSEKEIGLKVRERTRALYLEIIGSLDNIDRAISEARKDEGVETVRNVVVGLMSIRKSLVRSLEDNGVTVVDPIGEPFDPKWHESIGSIENNETFSDTVVKVDLTGFTLDGMVLRPAKVFISRGGPRRPREERPEMDTLDFDIDADIEELEEAEEAGEIVEVGKWAGNGDDQEMVGSSKKEN